MTVSGHRERQTPLAVQPDQLDRRLHNFGLASFLLACIRYLLEGHLHQHVPKLLVSEEHDLWDIGEKCAVTKLIPK